MRAALTCLFVAAFGLAGAATSSAQTLPEPAPALAQADLAALSADYRIYEVVRVEAGQKVYRAHAIAMHGEPKYPADFPHFNYVNPEAPKGGRMTVGSQGTFDSFNAENGRGNAVGAGYETLLQSSHDEAFTMYGLLAEWVEWPEDRSWVTFRLREEARWHDGQPITVDDVIWSYNTLVTDGQPFYRFYFGAVDVVEEVGDRQVRFTFSERDNRELPLIIGQMPVMPKHYWEDRDFTATTLDPPLVSGPYRIANFEAGRFVVRERVEDYWGADLPINVGRHNFDRMRTEFFRDATIIRTALKAGTLDFRRENQAKAWALDYNIPAVQQGWLRQEAIRHNLPTGMQAFVMNTRNPLFQDPRVRRALAFAFDFEWTNAALFFDLYARTSSYFSNSELAATGLPDGEELEILERFRDELPDEVFTTPYWVPSTDGSGWPRDNLIRALELLNEAGWEVRDLQLVNAETGQPMRFEILLVSPAFERIVLPFVRNLTRLGIDARVRLVDQSQYINRLRSFEFDMIVNVWGQSDSPGNEQRDFWSSGGRRPAAQPQSCRHPGSGHRRTDQPGHHGTEPRVAGGPHARAGSRVAVGPLHHTAVALPGPQLAVLGQVRAARDRRPVQERHGNRSLVVRSSQGRRTAGPRARQPGPAGGRDRRRRQRGRYARLGNHPDGCGRLGFRRLAGVARRIAPTHGLSQGSVP